MSTKRSDFASGLVYFDYRFYVPHLGRWLNRDPLQDQGGINLYAYGQGDPLGYVDPDGRFAAVLIYAVPTVIAIAAFYDGLERCKALGRCDFSGLWHSNEAAESEGDSSDVPVNCPAEGEGSTKNKWTRGKNKLSDRGEPNTVAENSPGTTRKKYGPDGHVQKEWNKGHGPNYPKNEQDDHIHDYKPNPRNPSGRGERMEGRPPRRKDLQEMGF